METLLSEEPADDKADVGSSDYVQIDKYLSESCELVGSKTDSNSIYDSDYLTDTFSDDCNQSLSNHFPISVQIGVISLLIAVASIFIWSNFSVGTWVRLEIRPNFSNASNGTAIDDLSDIFAQISAVSGGGIVPPSVWDDLEFDKNVFHFTLFSSVKDFWQSRAYMLTFLIAIFSGIWPYIKLILLALVWLKPLPSIYQKRLLIILDQMGKFSFIDLYVCLFMIVSFYIKTTALNITVTVTVEPAIGITTFVIGNILSMLISHSFLYIHSAIASDSCLTDCRQSSKLVSIIPTNDKSTPAINDCSEDEQILHVLSFRNSVDETTEIVFERQLDTTAQIVNRKQKQSYNRYPLFLKTTHQTWLTIFAQSVLLVIIIALLWITIQCIWIKPVKYTIDGLAGIAVNSDSQRLFSIWNIINDLTNRNNNYNTSVFLNTVFIVTLVVFPILVAILFLLIWFAPISDKRINKLGKILLICFNWCAIDVFLIANIAAAVELKNVSQWIIDQNYSEICGDNGIVYQYTHIGCFSVNGSLTPELSVMITCVVCQWFIALYTFYRIYSMKNGLFHPKSQLCYHSLPN